MSSNFKPKSSPKESPTEPFKRAVTGCLRAIAKKPELEVAFAAERPGLIGGKVRLPEPPRRLTRAEAAIVRGHADSVALKLACHDPNVHRKLVPGGQQARAVFEAVEQARVEAIGARRMAGVAKNLTAMLDDNFHRGKFDDITDRADAPIEDAIALMVRERLTGQAPPPAAKKLVDLWRPFIEDKAGRGLDRLERLIEDQRASATRCMTCSIRSTWARIATAIPKTRKTIPSAAKTIAARTRKASRAKSPESDDMQRMSIEEAEASAEDAQEATAEAVDAPSSDMADDADMGDSETPAEPWRPRAGHNEHRGPDYGAFVTKFDERSRPRICASRKNSTACAAISTSNCRICRAWSPASPTGCSAA